MNSPTRQQIYNAIQSDIVLKELYLNLHRLYNSELPSYEFRHGEMYIVYSDRFKAIEATIKDEIAHREHQIKEYYKPIYDKL